MTRPTQVIDLSTQTKGLAPIRTAKVLVATIALLLVAVVFATEPALAGPSPKVLFSAELTGTSETTYPDDAQPNLFHQETTFEVNGRYKNRSMTGTLHYEYRVLSRGADLPPELTGAYIVNPNDPDDWELVQQATLTTNLGDLSWETSPYMISHIGFECLPDASHCAHADATEDNAVILAFGPGTGIFASESFPDLWTMRVERHGPATGNVTGSLSGGVGRSFKNCFFGDMETTASTGGGTLQTTVSLTTTHRSACRDEYGQLVNNSLEGGALNLDYQFNWDVTGDPAFGNQPLYPDLTAQMWNKAGTMTGTTSSFFLIDPGTAGRSWYRHHIALGGQWGEIVGVYGKYPYTYLDVSFGFTGNGTVPGIHTVEGALHGIVAVYDVAD